MYVIIENHFIKDHCFNKFMELAEEIIEHCRTVKGCLFYNVFERKSVGNQAIMIAYWDKVHQYIQFLKTQKVIYLKNRLQTTLERSPHVDLYYSLASANDIRAHHFRRASLNHKAQSSMYNPTYSHSPNAVGEGTNERNEVDTDLGEYSQFFMHLSRRYINISTSSELLMRMREKEIDRKRLEMLEEQRKSIVSI